MSKMTNDYLTQSGTECYVTTVGVQGLNIMW